ncbi:MAG: ribonuclease HI family protein [Synergistaceae bacterium]|nr:ribonuclease HI family protein [Synergistaceae bacterium]
MTGYFDGASRGNPGLAGAGACLIEDGQVVWECAEYLGTKTNNEAEYTALLRLLEEAKSRGVGEVEIKGDSKLVVCQVNRQWKINLPHLRALAAEAWRILDGMNARITWIPREENRIADALSNRAIDERK